MDIDSAVLVQILCVGLLIILVYGLGSWVPARQQGQTLGRAWEEAATSLGLTLVEEEAGIGPVLVGAFGARPTKVEILRPLSEGGVVPAARVTLLEESLSNGMSLQSSFGQTGSSIPCGDPGFDSLVTLGGTEHVALSFLSHSVRALFMDAIALREFCFESGQASCKVLGGSEGLQALETALAELSALLDKLSEQTRPILSGLVHNAVHDLSAAVRRQNARAVLHGFGTTFEARLLARTLLVDPDPEIRLLAASAPEVEGHETLLELVGDTEVPTKLRGRALAIAIEQMSLEEALALGEHYTSDPSGELALAARDALARRVAEVQGEDSDGPDWSRAEEILEGKRLGLDLEDEMTEDMEVPLEQPAGPADDEQA